MVLTALNAHWLLLQVLEREGSDGSICHAHLQVPVRCIVIS